MGWPPALTVGDREVRDDSQRTNPLLEAFDSSLSRLRLYFCVLSVLQALQQKRAHERIKTDFLTRQENSCGFFGFNADKSFAYVPLQAMEELVSPFATQALYHFKKWVQKPELICFLTGDGVQLHGHEMSGSYDPNDRFDCPTLAYDSLMRQHAQSKWSSIRSFLETNLFLL